MKLFPTYQLSVETGPFDANGNATQHVDIWPPYTVEFEISRKYLASAQTATFRVSQLGEATRNQIYKDRITPSQFAGIQFRAGYQSEGGSLPLIFNGTLIWAYSERNDATNFQTVLNGYDGGYAASNGFTSRSFAGGTSLAQIISSLNFDLPKVFPTPVVGSFPQTLPRGQALLGPTFKLIQGIIPRGALATIDNNQLKVLNANEYISGPTIPTISSLTGLLRPPVRSGAIVTCDILFEPAITIGQLVNLQSDENSIFNGQRMVVGIEHRGTISGGVDASGRVWPGAVGGENVTTLTLWFGTELLNPVSGALPQ